jgi:nucleoside 2-deoxyribosyltransferase
MIGDFVALYLSEEDFKRATEINKKFEPHYTPYLVIRILNHYNEDTFEGLLCQGTTTFNISKCLTKHNSGSSQIVLDYNENKNGFFTFDGVRFFKIVNAPYKSDNEGLIVFTFRYISRPSFSERNSAFMFMPFRHEQLNQFYEKNIKSFLKSCDLGIRVYRSDDFAGTDVVADTILNQIKKTEFVICDITNCNKNVFFEIGYAKGLNKDIIFLLEQNKPAEFFDVNHIRRIEYSYDRENEFQNLLRDTLLSIRNTRLY